MRTLKKLRILFLLFSISFVIPLIILQSSYVLENSNRIYYYNLSSAQVSLTTKNDSNTSDTKTGILNSTSVVKNENSFYKILYWTNASKTSYTLGHDWFGMGEGTEPFQSCEYQNCELTSKRSDFNSSDAVLFHLWLINNEKNIDKCFPSYRPSYKQKWIVFIGETPYMAMRKPMFRGKGYKNLNKLFNVTWTYNKASDLVTDYSDGYLEKVIRNTTSNNYNTTDYTGQKHKLVAVLMSNCRYKPHRLRYIKNLQKYIDVDIYGECGDKKCPKTKEESCLQMLEFKYKFYLAFENHICKDYVTEKLWKIVPNLNLVPIVYGGANYSSLLPPNSYIDVGDYATPADLANHLKDLHSNDAKYNKYFEWKNHYVFKKHKISPQCKLCKYLHENAEKVNVYDRLDLFWNAKSQCSYPSAFYKNVNKNSWVTV